MSIVRFESLTKRFSGRPPTVAMDDLTLTIEKGEFLVLLGPSGCGKTTTLRCLAGLETADEGTIRFGDRTVFDSARGIDVSPDKRNIGMVFQSYALWPHMRVRKNIELPLRARGLKNPEHSDWVRETAALVDCEGLLDRYPAELSGGQQQRVALARGLVARPELVLFDEPMSNLDARLRDVVRGQLHELHQKLAFSAVFVTHDQREALALADRVAIMRQGRFEQVGTPREIFQTPVTEYVAGFIGVSNRLLPRRSADGWEIDGVDVHGLLPVPRDVAEPAVRVRPEDVNLSTSVDQVPSGVVSFRCTVVDVQFGGRELDVSLSVGSSRFTAVMPAAHSGSGRRDVAAGAEIVAWMAPHSMFVFDSEGRACTEHASVVAGRTA